MRYVHIFFLTPPRFRNVVFEITSVDVGKFEVSGRFLGRQIEKVELVFQVRDNYYSKYIWTSHISTRDICIDLCLWPYHVENTGFHPIVCMWYDLLIRVFRCAQCLWFCLKIHALIYTCWSVSPPSLLPTQDLLQLQYEGLAIMKMFGRAKVNVNLLIFLINKKFYGRVA